MVKSTDNSNNGGEYTGVHMAVDLLFAAIIIGAYVAGYYYFEPFKNVDQMGDQKFKVEVKKAADVE